MTQDAVPLSQTAAPAPPRAAVAFPSSANRNQRPMHPARRLAFITLNGLLAGLGLFLALNLLPELRGGDALAWLASGTAKVAFVRELCFGFVMAWALRPRATTEADA